jgi:hypothetical protein
MQKFELLLKNEKLKLYYRFNLFISFGLSLLFIYFVFFTENDLSSRRKIILSGIAILFLAASLIDKKKDRQNIFSGSILYLAFAWSVLKIYWLAVSILALGLLFILSIKRKIVVLDTKKIIYPSFPKKQIRWSELNNVMLKDGLLTIDFKNNKLIQQVIDESVSSVNEQEFNEFCKEQFRLNIED